MPSFLVILYKVELRGSGHQAPVPNTPIVPSGTELELLIRNMLVSVLEQYRTDTKAEIAEQVKQMVLAIYPPPSAAESQNISTSSIPAKELQPRPVHPSFSPQRRRREASLPVPGAPHPDRETRIDAAYRELLQENSDLTEIPCQNEHTATAPLP